MDENWVKVYTSSDFFKVELARQFLIDNEIDAVLINKQGYPYNIGEVELYVQPENTGKAGQLIQQHAL